MSELEQRIEALRSVRARLTRKATGESDRTETAADVAQRDGLILALDLAEKSMQAEAERAADTWWVRLCLVLLGVATLLSLLLASLSAGFTLALLGALHG